MEQVSDQEGAYRRLQRRADRISSLIVASDYPAIDIVSEIRNLREFVESRFPDRMRLFEMVYESRFRRLWEQFRDSREEPLPDW
ncbi:MAG: hypothetical protein R6X33_12310 [Candidatus Brocadiia bacterium]